jgi:hypothetical protein
MSEEARDEEAWRDEMAAFEARFPPEVFEPIAKALGKTATPQNLKRYSAGFCRTSTCST